MSESEIKNTGTQPRADITPAVLKWARERSNLSIELAAKRIGVNPERYALWENEDSSIRPTFTQLRKTAKVLHRPPSLFYLATPPVGFKPIKDLRQSMENRKQQYSPALVYEMELAQQRREILLELAGVLGHSDRPFNISADVNDDPEVVALKVRTELGVDFESQQKWRKKSELTPFQSWRRAIEDVGVLVFQMTRVNWEEASGFALATRLLPIVVVNRKDVANRRTFSLLHEFAHLVLGQTSASDLEIDMSRTLETEKIEAFCNAVAGAALVPQEYLLNQPEVRDKDRWSDEWSDIEVANLAKRFGVSRVVVLRRLLTFQKTTKAFYERSARRWSLEFKEFLANKRRELDKRREDKSTSFGLDSSKEVMINFGQPYVGLVLESLNTNVISVNEASRLLGNLRIRHFEKLEREFFSN